MNFFSRIKKAAKATVGGYKVEEIKDPELETFREEWEPVDKSVQVFHEAITEWIQSSNDLEYASHKFLIACEAALGTSHEGSPESSTQSAEVQSPTRMARLHSSRFTDLLSKKRPEVHGAGVKAKLTQLEGCQQQLSSLMDEAKRIRQELKDCQKAREDYQYYHAKKQKLDMDAQALQQKGKTVKPAMVEKCRRADLKDKETEKIYTQTTQKVKTNLKQAIASKNSHVQPIISESLLRQAEVFQTIAGNHEKTCRQMDYKAAGSMGLEDFLGENNNDDDGKNGGNKEGSPKTKAKKSPLLKPTLGTALGSGFHSSTSSGSRNRPTPPPRPIEKKEPDDGDQRQSLTRERPRVGNDEEDEENEEDKDGTQSMTQERPTTRKRGDTLEVVEEEEQSTGGPPTLPEYETSESKYIPASYGAKPLRTNNNSKARSRGGKHTSVLIRQDTRDIIDDSDDDSKSQLQQQKARMVPRSGRSAPAPPLPASGPPPAGLSRRLASRPPAVLPSSSPPPLPPVRTASSLTKN